MESALTFENVRKWGILYLNERKRLLVVDVILILQTEQRSCTCSTTKCRREWVLIKSYSQVRRTNDVKPLCNELELRSTQQRIFIIVVFMKLEEEGRRGGNLGTERRKWMNAYSRSLACTLRPSTDGPYKNCESEKEISRGLENWELNKFHKKRKQGVCWEKAGSAGLDLRYPSIFKMKMDKEKRYDWCERPQTKSKKVYLKIIEILFIPLLVVRSGPSRKTCNMRKLRQENSD